MVDQASNDFDVVRPDGRYELRYGCDPRASVTQALDQGDVYVAA
jgi:hypothetical protein